MADNLTSRKVYQDFRRDSVSQRVRETFPNVADVTFLVVQPRGSIVYDILTQTLWYSDGVRWLPINSDASCVITSTFTVYANAGTGSDTNNGLSSSFPVATVQKAIDILSKQGFIREGIILLEGTTPFVLGTELNFFPTVSNVGCIVIRGVRGNLVSDTVVSTATLPPMDQWHRITPTTGGYGVNTYQTFFGYNNRSELYFTVSANAAGTVDVVTDDILAADTYDLFTIGTTVLQYSGDFELKIPYGKVTFEFVHLVATVDESTWNNTPSLPISVFFRACHLDSRSTTGSYTNSMDIKGCYSNGTITSSMFNSVLEDLTNCMETNSFWFENGNISFVNNCVSSNIYSTNGINNSVTVEGGIVKLTNVYVLESGPTALKCRNTTGFNLTNIEVTNIAIPTSGKFGSDNAIGGVIQNIRFNNIGTFTIKGAELTFNNFDLGGALNIESQTKMLAQGGVAVGNILVRDNSTLFYTATVPITIDRGALTTPCINVVNNSTVLLDGAGANYDLRSAGTAILIQNGSSLVGPTGIVNSGISDDVVQVGGNAVVPFFWATDNDLGAGVPENCFLTVS